MKRVVGILAVAVLMAVLLVASISPAMARRAAGGVLLPTKTPCYAHSETKKNDREAGAHLVLNPEGRAPGCWALLPDSAVKNE